MKFTILINQHAIDQKGLTDSTDLIDWAIMDYIQKWLTSPKAQRMGRKVWINYKHIIKEMPLLGLKAKSSISNRITKLTELGLLSTEKDDSCRLFADLTELAHEIISFHGGSQDCTGVPENERGVHSEERGVPNQERGVPENEHSTNQHTTNQQIQEKESKPKKNRFVKPTAEQVRRYLKESNNDNLIDADAFIDYYQAKDWMIGSNRMKDWRAAVRTWIRRENKSNDKSGNESTVKSEIFHRLQQSQYDQYEWQNPKAEQAWKRIMKTCNLWQASEYQINQILKEVTI